MAPEPRRGEIASERVDPGQLTPDHELVHGLGAFVSDDRFQVQRMSDGAVLSGDASSTKNIEGFCDDFAPSNV